MPPLQNNELRSSPSERGKGLAGTALLHGATLLLMVFVGFSAPKPPEPENGILVNFGTDEGGAGSVEPSAAAILEEAIPPPPSENLTPVTEDAIVTQEFDKEAPEVKKVDPEAEKRKKELADAEKARLAQIEADRKRRALEEAERKRMEEEQRRVNEISNRTKNAFANAKNTGTNSTGEGITGGPGNQGVPTGSVDSKIRGTGIGTGDSGISYELAGRKFQTLPPPRYDYQGEGKVIVDINVDRSGNVTQAIPGVKGSTTLDEYLLNAAKEAALKTKFEPRPDDASPVQKGTITYNFKLK